MYIRIRVCIFCSGTPEMVAFVLVFLLKPTNCGSPKQDTHIRIGGFTFGQRAVNCAAVQNSCVGTSQSRTPFGFLAKGFQRVSRASQCFVTTSSAATGGLSPTLPSLGPLAF